MKGKQRTLSIKRARETKSFRNFYFGEYLFSREIPGFSLNLDPEGSLIRV